MVVDLLDSFWALHGVRKTVRKVHFPYGACTFDILTIDYALKGLNGSISPICFSGMCYRPFDLVDTSKVIRFDNYVQYQVLLYSDYMDSLDLVRSSVDYIFGKKYHCNFVVDNWSAPTMGAYGYGWEGRILGLEFVQITHFTNFGGIDISDRKVLEIVYGVERLNMLYSGDCAITRCMDYDCPDYFDNVNIFSSMCDAGLIKYMYELLALYSSNDITDVMKVYYDFLKLNLVFNILDGRSFFSEQDKNMYMYSISKLFKRFVVLYQCQ